MRDVVTMIEARTKLEKRRTTPEDFRRAVRQVNSPRLKETRSGWYGETEAVRELWWLDLWQDLLDRAAHLTDELTSMHRLDADEMEGVQWYGGISDNSLIVELVYEGGAWYTMSVRDATEKPSRMVAGRGAKDGVLVMTKQQRVLVIERHLLMICAPEEEIDLYSNTQLLGELAAG